VLDHSCKFDAEVVAIDANTRKMSAADAAAETERIARSLWLEGQILFKKIDSTLKGHIAEEIAAIRRVRPSAKVVMAPAFPAQGRTTRNGWQHMRGNLLGDLRAIVPEAIVCDANSDEDLRDIAASLGPETIWVGTAGLARHLPGQSRRQAVAPRLEARIAIIVGSPSEVSREQARRLAAGLGDDQMFLIDDAAEAEFLCRDGAQFGGFIFTGGETARAGLDALGVRALRMVREIEPGVPLSLTAETNPRPVITKAGAFGDPETLVRCRAALRDL